jgi:hypothetical protein
VRKLAKPEKNAWAASPETDSQRQNRQPYAARERAPLRRDFWNPEPGDYYEESLDVSTFPGHSPREAQPRSRWLMFGDIALARAQRKHSRAAKVIFAEMNKVLKSINQRRLEFLNIDLDLALTMAHIAISADNNPEKRNRNQRNARHAYDEVLRLRSKTEINARENEQLNRKLMELQTLLLDLGEPAPSFAIPA